MLPLMIGITTVAALLIVAALALAIIRQARNAHDDAQGPMRGGTRVLATITDVQIRQEWRYGEKWERNSWDGSLVRGKTWRTYYDVTAHWLNPQTKQSCTSHSKIWSDDFANVPTAGDTIVIIVDLRHPQEAIPTSHAPKAHHPT
jgi:hypothetical protein